VWSIAGGLFVVVVAGVALVASRHAKPDVETVAEALAGAGIHVTDLRPIDEQLTDRAVFLGRSDAGPVRVAALAADGTSRAVSRLSRFVLYRHSSPPVGPRARQQIEREATLERDARSHGAPVPEVISVYSVGALSLVAERIPDGPLLATADASRLDDACLAALWAAMDALHAAGFVHGKLDGHHVVLPSGAPVMIIGFEGAAADTRARLRNVDAAQLLAVTAARVGSGPAVDAALTALGGDHLAGVIPFLQPALVSGWTHDAFGGHDAAETKLEDLRDVASKRLGIEPPELQKIYRVHPRHVIMTVSALVAVGTLISRIGHPAAVWHEIQHADWALVLLAFALAMLTDVVFGLTFLGNVAEPIGVWSSIELQVGMAFSNLAIPVAADAAIQVRFLQRQGLDLASATAAGGFLSAASEIGVQIAVFFVAVALSPDQLDFGHIDTRRVAVVVGIVVFAVGVVGGVLFSVRAVRGVVVPPMRRGLRSMGAALRSPARLALLLGGNVLTQLLTAASLLACLAAFGHGISFWTVLAVNIGVSLLASIVPLPGGGTAVSLLGLGGAFVAVGVPRAPAAAAVLTYQIVHGYLPAIPGWFAMNDLLRKQLL
jgi:undecaprenyl-diphosphatase